MKLVFHPAARAELEAAGDWYDERVSGLGDGLIDAVEDTATRIAEAPERYAVLPSEPRARRLVVAGFPFSVVYTVAGDTLFIVAIAHHRRRPGYWMERMDDAPTERQRRR